MAETFVLNKIQPPPDDILPVDVSGSRFEPGSECSKCRYDRRYVAISYVWGGVSQLLLTTSNKAQLFAEKGLETCLRNIPQVIKDAIHVVRCLGESLLWVDSLCIVQDDKIEKHHLISEMASIYNQALVTIIEASGNSANHGLPGVSENSRILEDAIGLTGADVDIMDRQSLSIAMQNSAYNTRGWTFQERLLSRRCLYFTGSQLFFECQVSLPSEDRFKLPRGNFEGSEILTSGNLIKKDLIDFGDPLASGHDQKMLRYNRIVEEYCHKHLSYEEDVLSAFAGIASAMEQLCGWTMVYGLPEQLLSCAILWEQQNATILRQQNPIGVRQRFPTWSWSAWSGGVQYNEWTASDLKILSSPFKIVHSVTGQLSLNTLPGDHSNPSILRFSMECLPGYLFSWRITTFRNKETCSILNTQEEHVGIIPGVGTSFIEEYVGSSVELVLLSAPKLSVHRFASVADLGYPEVFDRRFPMNDWSVLTIMLVKREGSYVRRVALTYMHRDAWKEAHPNVQRISLA